MKIIVAQSAGFCFGVKRAVELVLQNIGKYQSLSTYGPIIHNPQVVEQLRQQGVCAVESPEQTNTQAVVIRSHGATPEIYKAFAEKGIVVLDATCPYVHRIQQTVQKAWQEGEMVVIIGEKEHPEVVGINGYCGNTAYIVNGPEEVAALPDTEKAVCVVAQTTSTQNKWQEVLEVLQKKYYNIKEYSTICYATAERQREAVEIAQSVSIMLVIGGRESSNTQKLYHLCREHCKRTYAVEDVGDIPIDAISTEDIIGITAGASTPDWLIKEVVTKMSEIEKLDNQGLSFEEEMDKTMVRIRTGQMVKGTVIYVNDSEIGVNIGYKSDGFVSKEELTLEGNVSPKEMYKPGDEIEVEVLKVNDGGGNVLLSRKAVLDRLSKDKVLAAIESGESFEVTIEEAVKGGLTAELDGIRVFIPASQIRFRGYVNELSKYVGQPMRVRALEVDIKKRRVVATHSQLVAEESAKAAEEAWGKLAEGETVKGIVRRLTDFGAFVDLGGVDGLIHIGDLAWYRVTKPSDILKVNDEVEVVILALDREKERISLGYKQLQSKPWDFAAEKYPVNSIVDGVVVRITPFGAFVALEAGIDGLVHISEVSNKFIKRVEDAVKVGQQVQALVLDVNPETKRISLSMKALAVEEEQPVEGEDTAEVNTDDSEMARVQVEDDTPAGTEE